MCDQHDNRKKPKIPFVNLHSHTTASPFDGMGYPEDHMEFVYENGMNAMAITDHGNMNIFPYQYFHAKKMNNEGRDFKPIYGMEGYFHPSIKKWDEVHKAGKGNTSDDALNATIVEDEDFDSAKSYLKERRHLTLIVKNQTGLYNLFEMISKSYERPNFYYYPRIDYDMLREHSEGLIATTSCLGGILAGEYWKNQEEDSKIVRAKMESVVENMVDIFGDSFYGEIQWNSIPEQHILNQHVIDIANANGIPLISTCDSHYPNPDAWKSREVYKRIGNPWIAEKEGPIPKNVGDMDYQLYPKNGDEVWDSYKEYCREVGVEYDDDLILDSIERTHEIAYEVIEDVEPDTSIKLPTFIQDTEDTPEKELEDMVWNKYNEKFDEEKPEYKSRVEKELDVITSKGFAEYFLTMKKIVDLGWTEMLIGDARGSAGGSLVAYLLEITQLDPIKYNLLFERFLRKDQSALPDIDTDFARNLRMKDFLAEKWGKDSVVPISNWNRLKLKSLIKDLARYHDIPFDEVNKVTSKMIYEATGPAKERHGIKAGVYTPTYEEVKEFSSSLQNFLKKYPDVEKHVDQLYGQIRSCGRHAGGLLVSENINKNMPLISNKGTIQCPWTEGQTVRHLEPLGFVKFDVLGLTTLAMMETTIEHLLRRHEGITEPTFEDIKKFYDENLHPDVIDLDDQEVWEDVYQEGNFAGTFQFTERPVQKFCTRAKPRNIIECATVTSIFRPGPLSAGVDKGYVEAKKNPQDVEYINDIYEEVTKESYGFIVFQEQIALLAHRLGKDISLDEGNILRKILTKKGLSEEKLKKKESIRGRFVEGCQEKGMSKMRALELWEKMEYFSGYGFNKSHAVGYSIISFQCAWLLHYYPECWLAGYLEEQTDNKMEKSVQVVQSLGYNISPPNIHESSNKWEISKDGKTFFQPLTEVKGIGEKGYQQIIKHRPFENIEDFLFKEEIDRRSLNKKAAGCLSMVGALDELMDDRFTGSKHFWSCISENHPDDADGLKENINNPELRNLKDFSTRERIENIFEYTKTYPLHLTMSSYATKQIANYDVPAIGEWLDHRDELIKMGNGDEDIKTYCWFVIMDIEVKQTKNDKDYYQLLVTDTTKKATRVKCWNIDTDIDKLQTHKPYLVRKIDYDETWGFSTGWNSKPRDNMFLIEKRNNV